MDSALPVLYGREGERAALRGALDAALAGRGSLVLVAGEAGIGKTVLVDDLVVAAEAAGMWVARGACYDLAGTPPYGPWLALLRAFPAESPPPALLESTRSNPSPAGQGALFAEVVRYLGQVAERQPLVLVLEDQHWADQDSLQLLRVVARSLAGMPALLVVTYRDVELTAGSPLYRVLPQLVRESRPLRLRLRPLAQDAVQALVASRYRLTPADGARLVAYLLETADGNPFFIEEILRTLEHDRLLTSRQGDWDLGDVSSAPVPYLVRQMIDVRIDWLGDEMRHLLQVAAVIGVEVPLDLWAAAIPTSDDALIPVVERALEAQLLVDAPQPGNLRFTHSLVREAVYESMVLPRRQGRHRRVAELLVARPNPDPDVIAHHFQRAQDPRAALWLIQAGERASRANAVQEAVVRFEQALQLLEGDDDALMQRVRLLCNLAGVYRYTDPARALVDLDRARDLADRLDDRTLSTIVRWNRARIRGFLAEDTRADIDEAIAAYHALSAEERARVRDLGRGVAGSQGALAQWLAHHGRYEIALAIGLDCLANPPPAEGADLAIETGHARLGVALSLAGLGRADAARTEFAHARADFSAAHYHFMHAAAVKWEVMEDALLFRADDPDEVERLRAEYARVWLLTGSETAWAEDQPLVPLYPPLLVSGQWERARATAEAYLGDAYLRIDALATLAEIERNRGECAAAWGRIQQALPDGPATLPGTPFFVRTLSLQRVAATLALDAGDLPLALAWIECQQRWLEWSGRLVDRGRLALLRARHAYAGGDLIAADALIQQARALSEAPRQPPALQEVLRWAGIITARLGRMDEAGGHFAASYALAAACNAPYPRALTVLEWAAALPAAAQPTAALDDAREVLRVLGARPALERLETLATPPASALDSTVPPNVLSARELDVLRLVARGLTDSDVADRLSISRRTVAGHLQSIYTKLNVSSRTAATAWAYEHEVV